MKIEDELIQLRIDKDNPMNSASSEETEIDLVAQMKAAKKARKAKKKNKSSDALNEKLDTIIGDIGHSDDIDEDAPSLIDLAKEIKKNSKKKGKKLEFDTDGFMGGEGKKRKKKKDLYKKYEAQFKDEEALLTALLKETSTDTAAIKKTLSKLLNSNVRGVSKAMTDLASTVVSANGNRLQIIKAKIDLKNKINDLVNKEESRKKDGDESSLDQEAFGASLMQGLFSQGNKEFNQQLKHTNAVSDAEFEALKGQAVQPDDSPAPRIIVPEPVGETIRPLTSIEPEAPKSEPVGHEAEPTVVNVSNTPPDEIPEGFDEEMESQLSSLNDEMKDDPIYGRSDAGDSLISHEAEGVQVKIKKWTDSDTGDGAWEFVAIDKYGDEVPDYEVPDRRKSEPIKFSDGTGLASDKFGRTYEVIDVGMV